MDIRIFEKTDRLKKTLLIILFLFIYCCTFSQSHPYWQQQVNYKIAVTLNDSSNTLDGFERMEYYNHSPDTLYYIWIHLWPNAYKNDRTAFSDQLLENGRKDFYFSSEEQRGYINRLEFKVDKTVALTEDHPKHQDIIKVFLPKPLHPGDSINIETPFHIKLPYNFSRGGYINKSYQVTQWYPKPAVYDKYGWHEMPYLDQGEFYSEFGEYDVQITIPKKYVVAATGILKDTIDNDVIKTLHYQQNNVHDFAWFADKDFEILHDTMQVSGRKIDVNAYYHQGNSEAWKNSIDFIKQSLRTKNLWIGEYPYDIVSVVEKPGAGEGGMEYPTITLINATNNEQMLDEVINHEVGHNWFYGVLATNERQHPWMDEGMNTYYDRRYMSSRYKNTVERKAFIPNRTSDLEDAVLESLINVQKDQPIETSSEIFSAMGYNLVVYIKTAQWMKLLEKDVTTPVFDKIMQEYYSQWKFKHPYPLDFKNVAEQVSGKNMDSLFSLLNKTGSLPERLKKNLKIVPFYSLKDTYKHHYIFVSPAIGYNFYDKLMIGGLIHNYALPESHFHFLVAPLYGTASKKWNGIGRLSYTFHPGNKGQNLSVELDASRFTVDQFTDSTSTKNYLSYHKIVPTIKYVFSNKDPRSSFVKYIQWKTFFINETGVTFNRDTIQQLDIINYPQQSRYINQLRLGIENNRALYPYSGMLQAEQGKHFIKLNLLGNYFFNYKKGGGLKFRFFAGKFIYSTEKTFVTQYETDRYHLNMSGPKGYEDYTYSNYFVGRNEFEGLSNQQIMIRDGAFKVRTDLLSDKTGKTDDWLSSANFTTTIPKQINPLELLPIKIPLKLFLDIGTYAEAWKINGGNNRFLYDAGFQVSLLKDVLNIYFPVLYSKVYKDYFKSTIPDKRFVKNISFSIDIQNISLRKLFPQISF